MNIKFAIIVQRAITLYYNKYGKIKGTTLSKWYVYKWLIIY